MRLAIAFCVLLASSGCVINAVRVETRTLPEKNPTAYQFEFSLEELRAEVMAGLDADAQRENPIFGGDQGSGGQTMLRVRDAEGASWVKVLQLPGYARDLYLETDHEPLWGSPIYRGPHEGLPFLASFHVHFAATSPTLTSVSVTAVDTEVLNGETWGLGICGPGTFNRYVRVEPTSIEEYVILRYIGASLGVPPMPEVILPAP